MCVSIFGSRSFSSVLAAGHSRLIGHQFLPAFRIGMMQPVFYVHGALPCVHMHQFLMLAMEVIQNLGT